MPTSPRNLTGGTGLYKRTAQSSNPRDDEGIVPYAVGEFCHSSSPDFHFQVSPPHPPLRRHPLHAGEGRDSPHPSRAAPGPPSPEGKASSGGGMIPAASSGGVLQDQPFQGFFQVFLVYAGIIDDQAVQVCGLGIKGAEGLDLQALGEECLGQGFVRQAGIHLQ